MPIEPKVVWKPVTANGDLVVGQRKNGRGTTLVLVSGGFGGGSVTGGYHDQAGAFQPATDAITAAGVLEIPAAATGMTLVVNVAGSSGVALSVGLTSDDMDLA